MKFPLFTWSEVTWLHHCLGSIFTTNNIMTWDNSYNRHNQFDYRSDNLSDDSNCRNSPWSSYQRNEKTFWCSLTQFSECSSIRKRFHNFIQTIFILPSCFHFEEKGKEKYAMKKQQMKIILSEGGTFFMLCSFWSVKFFCSFFIYKSAWNAVEMFTHTPTYSPVIRFSTRNSLVQASSSQWTLKERTNFMYHSGFLWYFPSLMIARGEI